MTAFLYDTTVGHVRGIDPPHAFVHRLALWLTDLDAPRLPWWLRPFARFDGRDHFDRTEPGDIRSKLDRWLAHRGVDLRGGPVTMLASARFLGYVFNPITVYWCHTPDGALECVVAEVHNTYGGRHAYLLRAAGESNVDTYWTDKELFVSPFQAPGGEYRLRLPQPGALLDLTVALQRGGTTPLLATLRGVRRPALARLVLTRPLQPQRVAALIRRHGIALWLRRAARYPVVAGVAGDRTAENPTGARHG